MPSAVHRKWVPLKKQPRALDHPRTCYIHTIEKALFFPLDLASISRFAHLRSLQRHF